MKLSNKDCIWVATSVVQEMRKVGIDDEYVLKEAGFAVIRQLLGHYEDVNKVASLSAYARNRLRDRARVAVVEVAAGRMGAHEAINQ